MSLLSGSSIRNRSWRVRDPVADVPAPDNVHPVAAQIAARRGVSDLQSYFVPSFKTSMPDPSVFPDMDAAVSRLALAIQNGEKVGIVGDYDVDGATSTALLCRLLALLGHHSFAWRIPHRIADGYGPNEDMIAAMKLEEGIDLLVIVDSGTAAFGPIAAARGMGLDVVVLDHHEVQGQLPEAVIVNPKRADGYRKFEYLCSAGLCFLFAAALCRELRNHGYFTAERPAPDIRSLLGLVALGTIADVVPLVELNRAYVQLGLPRLEELAGIRALMEVTGETKLSAHACGFVFGPCINAAGRLDDMKIGVELLLTDDHETAHARAVQLHEINEERRKVQNAAIEQAKETLTADPSPKPGIVLYDESWHPGIVGLVAAKVREAFDRPTIIIGAGGKGSARTVDGFDIGACVIEATQRGLLLKGGGHAMAAGLTIDPARVSEFRSFVVERLGGFSHPPVPVDLVIECGTLTPDMVYGFERLAPFGQGNTKPRVALVGGHVSEVRVLKGLHIKAKLVGSEGVTEIMAFSAIDTPLGTALQASVGRPVDVYGTVEVSTWNGVDSCILKPEDLMLGRVIQEGVAA